VRPNSRCPRTATRSVHPVRGLHIIGDTPHIRLDPVSAPRRSNALAALCTELTATATRYPGTDLTLAYSVKGHPEIN